jgi:hypothetical protein
LFNVSGIKKIVMHSITTVAKKMCSRALSDVKAADKGRRLILGLFGDVKPL